MTLIERFHKLSRLHVAITSKDAEQTVVPTELYLQTWALYSRDSPRNDFESMISPTNWMPIHIDWIEKGEVLKKKNISDRIGLYIHARNDAQFCTALTSSSSTTWTTSAASGWIGATALPGFAKVNWLTTILGIFWFFDRISQLLAQKLSSETWWVLLAVPPGWKKNATC